MSGIPSVVQRRPGSIVTFYSWKGGVGRTMALANAAVQLSRHGRNVLMVDWDLEAPGLDRYFFSEDVRLLSKVGRSEPTDPTGVLGLLTGAIGDTSPTAAWQSRLAQMTVPELHGRQRTSRPPAPGHLHLLPSGYHGQDFAQQLAGFSWPRFFTEQNGGAWLEMLRGQWRDAYDFVLIDSRTGLTDGGGVCTIQMPDFLVLVFTANEQSLTDGLRVVTAAQNARATFAFERAPLSVIPLLTRWEGEKEVDLGQEWMGRVEAAVSPLTGAWLPSVFKARHFLEVVRVPHVSRFAFGEPLPVLTHGITDPALPGLAYEHLARLLLSGLADAGRMIDPTYVPPRPPVGRTDAELVTLVADARSLAAEIERIARDTGPDSEDLLDFLLSAAAVALRRGDLAVAERLVKRALAADARTDLANLEDPRRLSSRAATHLGLGDVRRAQGEFSGASLSYSKALDLAERAVANAPGMAVFERELSVIHDRLGDTKIGQGDLSAALMSYQTGLMVRLRVAASDPGNAELQHDLSVSHDKIGNLAAAQGDFESARGWYQSSVAIAEGVASAEPGNAQWQRDLFVSHNKLGDAAMAQRDLVAARDSYQAGLVIAQRLAASDPGHAGRQRDLSVSHNKLGNVAVAQGDLPAAIVSYHADLAIAQRLATSDPGNGQLQRDLYVSHAKLGDVALAQGDLAEARAAYTAGLAIAQHLAASDPGNAQFQRDLYISHTKLGDVSVAQDDRADARASYTAAMAIAQRLAASDPGNTQWPRDLIVSCVKIAETDPAEARSVLMQALEIAQKLQQTGRLAPRDAWMPDELARRLEAAG